VDSKQFTPLGAPFFMTFQIRTFQGVRPSLFNFNTSGKPGGYADFDNYTVDEPRARGIEREIPLGKTITLASGTDGSFLAMNDQDSSFVNVPSNSLVVSSPNTRNYADFARKTECKAREVKAAVDRHRKREREERRKNSSTAP
jgi:hypothetical protein